VSLIYMVIVNVCLTLVTGCTLNLSYGLATFKIPLLRCQLCVLVYHA